MQTRLLVLILSTISVVACREGPVERKGAAQQLVIEKTYPVRLTPLREAILRTFAGRNDNPGVNEIRSFFEAPVPQ